MVDGKSDPDTSWNLGLDLSDLCTKSVGIAVIAIGQFDSGNWWEEWQRSWSLAVVTVIYQ